MKFVKDLREIGKKDAAIAGGKGAGLGELIQAGFAVPKGFVLLAGAFDTFLEATDINVEVDATLSTVDIKKMHTVEEAGEKIHALITNAKMPDDIAEEVQQAFESLGVKQVAVRSSATAEDSTMAAWAGQLETYLHTDNDSLIWKIQRCFASLFSPRAIFYRAKMAKDVKNISVAVVVQEMVESDAAGVAFSVHPVTEDRTQLLIEAVPGLGDKLVSGSVTPDTYVVDKDAWKLIDVNVSGDKQLMKNDVIVSMGKDIVRIEEHFALPMDIEWARKDGTTYFLQARPITTLAVKEKPIVPYSQNVEWKLFHTRPFSLFGATLWSGWYGSERIRELYNINIQKTLFFEEHRHVVRFYWGMEERKILWGAMESLIKDDIERYEALLKRAFKLNDEAEACLKAGVYGDGSLQQTFEFMVEVPIHATTLPNISFPLLAEIEPERHDLHELCEKLRAVSYYPKLTKQIFIPLVIKTLKELGVEDAENMVHLITLKELFAGDVSQLDRRKGELDKGNHFVYQCIDGKEDDWWIHPKKMHELVLEMENVSTEEFASTGIQLKGNIAYEGLVRGRARVVVGSGEGEEFDEGDILVTICSSPTMMPLIHKCAAIVTDEGGISCHAAVISRELKKPCVMNTKVATLTIADGDYIEVDADKGVVTLHKALFDTFHQSTP